MASTSGIEKIVVEGPSLSRRIRVSYIIAAVVAGAIIGAYIVAMVLIYELRGVGDPAAWGQFGDYIGGLLNPIMAALAFYWLTQSVKIQHGELSETRSALVESAQSQAKQVTAVEHSARISALVGFLRTIDAEISDIRHRQESFRSGWEKLAKSQNCDDFDLADARFFSQCTKDVAVLNCKRTRIMDDLARLLELPYLSSDAEAAAPSTG